MKSILKFIRMDWMNYKPKVKVFPFYILFAVLITTEYHSIIPSIIMLGVFIYTLLNFLFAGEEKNDMFRLYSILPTNKQEIVIGRYLLAILLSLLILIFSVFILFLEASILSIPIPYGMTINITLLAAAFTFFSIAVIFPINYKLGFIKSQSFAALPIILFIVIATLVPRILKINFFENPETIFNNLIGVPLFIIGIFLVIISSKASIKIMEQKE